MLCKEMIAVCFKGQKKTHKCNTWAEQSISEFKPASTYRDDWALRSLKKQRQKKICRPKLRGSYC